MIDVPGIYPHIPADEYHADRHCPEPSLSAGTAHRLAIETPWHAWTHSPRLNPGFRRTDKAIFDRGTAVHALLTGVGVDGIVEIDAPDWRTKAAKEAREEAYLAGLVPLLAEQAAGVRTMAQSILAQLDARGLGNPFATNDCEVSMFWQAGSVWNRSRPDILDMDNRTIWDLKTTGRLADPDGWTRTALLAGIHMRAAHYLEGAAKLLGSGWKYRLIVAESEAPFATTSFFLPGHVIELGAREMRRAQLLWRICLDRNVWPGWPDQGHGRSARLLRGAHDRARQPPAIGRCNPRGAGMAGPEMKFEPIEFLTPEEINRRLPIAIGLSGASGSGKTYSALALAAGMADAIAGTAGAPFAFIDTENRRGLHYRSDFPQMLGHYVDFGPLNRSGEMIGYPPERWIAMIDAIEAADVKAGVIDTFSAAWEGINGVLDLQATELERLSNGEEKKAERVGQLAWAAIKPRYRKLVNRIIRSKVDWVICSRAKPVMQAAKKIDGQWVEQNARKTKTRRVDVPWDVAADGDLLFEMTAMAILDPEHPGAPKYQIKVADQFRSLFRADLPLTAGVGRQMVEWSIGRGSAQEEKALMEKARAAARQGKAPLQDFYRPLPQDQKRVLAAILDELKDAAIKADDRPAASEDIFPTDAERAAALAAAEAAARAQEDDR